MQDLSIADEQAADAVRGVRCNRRDNDPISSSVSQSARCSTSLARKKNGGH